MDGCLMWGNLEKIFETKRISPNDLKSAGVSAVFFFVVACSLYKIDILIDLFFIKMAKDHRVTLTKRHAYRTISNRIKTIKTPG